MNIILAVVLYAAVVLIPCYFIYKAFRKLLATIGFKVVLLCIIAASIFILVEQIKRASEIKTSMILILSALITILIGFLLIRAIFRQITGGGEVGPGIGTDIPYDGGDDDWVDDSYPPPGNRRSEGRHKRNEQKKRREEYDWNRFEAEEEARRMAEEREYAEEEAKRKRGRYVQGGSCPHLLHLDSEFYEGWRCYKCEMTGATFEDEYCRKMCYYSEKYRNCPYYG